MAKLKFKKGYSDVGVFPLLSHVLREGVLIVDDEDFDLNTSTSLTGEEKVKILQNGKAVLTTTQDIADLAAGGGGGGSIEIQNITYLELKALYDAGTFTPLQWYRITDFQTIYDQVDFDNAGDLKSTILTKTGAVEPLLVLALSDKEISTFAFSELYPKDTIKYNINYTSTFINGNPAKGKIIERIDDNNNRTDYDLRAVKFIRYDDGAGNFYDIFDNGNASAEFLTFHGLAKSNYLANASDFAFFTGMEFSNNVFFGIAFSNHFSLNVALNTFDYTNGVAFNHITGWFTKNKCVGTVFAHSQISGMFNNSEVGNMGTTSVTGTFENGKITRMTDTTISGSLEGNQFLDEVFASILSGEIKDNTFSGKVLRTTLSGLIKDNTFSDKVSQTTLSGEISDNTFSGEVLRSILSGEISDNIFGEDINSSTINGQYLNNTIQTSIYITTINELKNKTISAFLGNNPTKSIIIGSDDNYYIRYFDGTNDVNTLII